MESFVVYIIRNSEGVLYKGYTSDITRRLHEHNSDQSRFTAGKGPWEIVLLEECDSKSSALKFENRLKKAGSGYLQSLITKYQSTLPSK